MNYWRIPLDYFHHQFPRRSISGLQSIYCRKCGREIARTPQAQFRTVSKCQICVLTEQGVPNAEEFVLAQYIQLDPTKPPVPNNAESAEYLYDVFPDERPIDGQQAPMTGVMGTVRSVYQAVGFLKDIVAKKMKVLPKSRKLADKKAGGSLYD